MMKKKTASMIAIGIGVSAAAGMAAMHKTKNARLASKAFHEVLSAKDEFAGELGQMARRAGKGMMRVGKAMDKLAK